MDKIKFSVLMSIYKNEKPEYLRQALDSILHQTVMAGEIVIVEDGELTPDLYQTLDDYQNQYPYIRRLPFKENRGLGLALRDGVLACRYEWIARMDTDDIAKPKRFEKQIAFLEQHPDIALLGTALEEFSGDPSAPDSITILPLTHKEILKFAKRRNPLRHVTVMFHKQAVLDSGNYRHFLWFEDYDLFVRMFLRGYKAANLPDVLMSVRADRDMFARRGGWKYLKQDIYFQKLLYSLGFISSREYVENMVIRGIVRLIPNRLRTLFYGVFLRERVHS